MNLERLPPEIVDILFDFIPELFTCKIFNVVWNKDNDGFVRFCRYLPKLEKLGEIKRIILFVVRYGTRLMIEKCFPFMKETSICHSGIRYEIFYDVTKTDNLEVFVYLQEKYGWKACVTYVFSTITPSIRRKIYAYCCECAKQIDLNLVENHPLRNYILNDFPEDVIDNLIAPIRLEGPWGEYPLFGRNKSNQIIEYFLRSYTPKQIFDVFTERIFVHISDTTLAKFIPLVFAKHILTEHSDMFYQTTNLDIITQLINDRILPDTYDQRDYSNIYVINDRIDIIEVIIKGGWDISNLIESCLKYKKKEMLEKCLSLSTSYLSVYPGNEEWENLLDMGEDITIQFMQKHEFAGFRERWLYKLYERNYYKALKLVPSETINRIIWLSVDEYVKQFEDKAD